MKKLAIIILNWNGIDLLRQLFPVVAPNSIGDEADLFVADNGSTDGSVDFVEKNFPQVKMLRFKENLGFAGGYNEAIKEVAPDYPYVILLNSDVETPQGWWQPMLKFMEENPHVGAIQPKIRSFFEREMFEYAGAAGGYLDSLGYPYCRGRMFEHVEKDEGQYDNGPADVTWASGAALMTRSELYLKLGGLDQDFFAHMEEIDYCCRVLAAGYRVCAIPDSLIYHMGGASLNQGNPRKTYLNFRNNLLLLHKNLPRRKGKRILFIRRLFDSLAFMMFVCKGDFKNARAILKAHSDFRKMRRNYTTFPTSDIFKGRPGSRRLVTLEHYLLRKKR